MNTTSPERVWFDGTMMNLSDVRIPLLTHSLYFGSAVFEGIRCYLTPKGSAVFRLEDHIDHLFHSAQVMGMRLPYTKDQIIRAVADVVRENNFDECYIRPIFFYGEKMDLLPEGTPIHVAISAWQWGKYLAKEAITVKVSPHVRTYSRPYEMTAKISGNYANSIMALLDAKGDGFDKALLLDGEGYIAEGSGENIFFVEGKVLHTPTEDSILPGMGGKATTMYGIKLGLKNCSPDSVTQGVKQDVVVLSTKAGHPSHISDSEWLGIGSANTIRLGTDKDTRVDLKEMEEAIREVTKGGKKIAAIIISGGTTNDMVVDPIGEVVNLRDRLTRELGLDYVPHVHVDTVVAFPWIFFKDYEFGKNSLHIDKEALERISTITKYLKDLHRADSFGIDFHKMGFCPYVSSVFMVREGASLTGKKDAYNWPFLYSMENSRSADGPNSAYVALNVLGVQGFQALIGYLTEVAVHLQAQIEKHDEFEVINKTGLGTAVMFVPRLPKNVLFPSQEAETAIRNSYAMAFIERLSDLGNPFYIDKIPSDSTGGNPFPYTSLKAYIMSPYSSKESNMEFVSFMVKLKAEIDGEFDFNFNSKSAHTEDAHPLK